MISFSKTSLARTQKAPRSVLTIMTSAPEAIASPSVFINGCDSDSKCTTNPQPTAIPDSATLLKLSTPSSSFTPSFLTQFDTIAGDGLEFEDWAVPEELCSIERHLPKKEGSIVNDFWPYKRKRSSSIAPNAEVNAVRSQYGELHLRAEGDISNYYCENWEDLPDYTSDEESDSCWETASDTESIADEIIFFPINWKQDVAYHNSSDSAISPKTSPSRERSGNKEWTSRDDRAPKRRRITPNANNSPTTSEFQSPPQYTTLENTSESSADFGVFWSPISPLSTQDAEETDQPLDLKVIDSRVSSVSTLTIFSSVSTPSEYSPTEQLNTDSFSDNDWLQRVDKALNDFIAELEETF